MAALVAFRVGLALAVLAASGHALVPGFPVYRYDPLSGDAYAYYFALRELLATWQREAVVVLPVAALAAAAVIVAVRRRVVPPALVTVGACAAGAVAAVVVLLMRSTGAPTVGWSLVLSVPFLPYRVVGLPLDPDVVYAAGTFLSLAFVAVILVATYILGTAATGSRRIGIAAAVLFAAWPVIALVVGGDRGAGNGTWQGELGISLTVEPLSTALVLSALVLVVRRRIRHVDAALAGALLGLSVVVRLSNVLIGACVFVALAVRDRRAAAWFVPAATALALIAAAYWPRGYASLEPPTFPEHPFALDYAGRAWTDSLLWRPAMLLLLLPMAIVGTRRVAPRTAALLWSCVLATAAFFSVYEESPDHPRFLFVVLPIVLVLWAAGAAELVAAVSARRATTIGAR
ncbi:MAG TPA: hypothetical protein VGJ70_23490 [Solirubrobacteraceae bacterium]